MQNNMRQGLSPSLTRSVLACFALGLGWCCEHPQNQRDVWFSVFPSEGASEGNACDEILKDLLHQELVLRDVVKASKQHSAAWRDGWCVLIHLSPSSAEGQVAAGQG